MKTLLMNPPTAYQGKFVSREQCGIGVVEKRFLPSEILLSAGYLEKQGHEVSFVDLGDGEMDFAPYSAVVVWVSVLHTYESDLKWLARAKESGCRTVMVLNEPYGRFEAETMERHPFVDAAVRLPERELSLDALLKSWERNETPEYPGLLFRRGAEIADTGRHPLRRDLSHLTSCAEWLRRQPLKEYDAVGITPGRGCSAGCGFCLYAATAQRKRPIPDVLEEVETVAGEVNHLFFLDPDLPSTREWTTSFCRELARRRLPVRWRSDLRPEDAEPGLLELLHASGCEEVLMAVETLDPAIREKIGAGLSAEQLRSAIRLVRGAGIRPVVFFYIGLPWDGPESLARIEDFLRSEPLASFFLKQVRPWPGTPVGEAFRTMKLLDHEPAVGDYAHSDRPFCRTEHLSLEELAEWKRRIGRAGILQPGYAWRFLRERRLRPKHVLALVKLLAGRNIFNRS